jgi:hypothetical protein
MEHPIGHGVFFHLRKEDGSALAPEVVSAVNSRMLELVEKDMYFHRYDGQTE